MLFHSLAKINLMERWETHGNSFDASTGFSCDHCWVQYPLRSLQITISGISCKESVGTGDNHRML